MAHSAQEEECGTLCQTGSGGGFPCVSHKLVHRSVAGTLRKQHAHLQRVPRQMYSNRAGAAAEQEFRRFRKREERNSLLLEVTLMLEVAASLRVENEISL